MTATATTAKTTAAAIAKLTKLGRPVMEAIANGQVGFFDNGLAEGSGTWGEVLAQETGVKAGVLTGLVKQGLFTSYLDDEGTWMDLTDLGAEVANQLVAPKKVLPATAAKPTRAAAKARIASASSIEELTSAMESAVENFAPAKKAAAKPVAKKAAAKPVAKKAAAKPVAKKTPSPARAEAKAARTALVEKAGSATTIKAAMTALGALAALRPSRSTGKAATHKPMTPTALPFEAKTLQCWGACGEVLEASAFNAGTPGKTRRTECAADARERLEVNVLRAAAGLEVLPRPRATV